MAAQVQELQEPREEEIMFPAPEQETISDEEMVRALEPKEAISEGITPISRNDTTEAQLSRMGGGESFDDLKVIVRNRDRDTFNKVAQAISSLPIAKPTDIADALKRLNKTKIPTRTLGGYAAEAILKDHPPSNKEITAKEFNISEGKNIINNSVKDNLGGEDVSYEEFINTPSELVAEAMRAVGNKETFELNPSFKDFLNFVNPLGGADPNGMDIEVWNTITDIASGEFDSEDFDKRMTSNYGENWVGRFSAFAIKEIAIDGALLILAATGLGTPLAASLFGARRAYLASKALRFGQKGFKNNARSIMARSVIVGLGGGSVQAEQNYVLDRDINFGMEVAYRLGGNALFEGLAVGARTGFKALKGRNLEEISKNAAKGGEIKAISRKEINRIMDGEQFATSPYASISREHLFEAVEGYVRVSGMATENLFKLDAASDAVMDGLSAFLGVDKLAIKDIHISAIMNDLVGFKGRIDKAGAEALANQVATSQGLTPHLLSLVRGEYGDGSRMAQMYMNGGTLQFRVNDSNINSSNITAVNTILKGLHLAEPDRIAGRSGADFLDVNNFSNKLANGFMKLYEDAMGKQRVTSKATTKFNVSEINTINSLIEEGDQAGKVFDFESVFPENIHPKEITPEIKTAYIKTRAVLDIAYELRNKSLVANLKGLSNDPKTGKLFIVKGEYVEIIEKLANNKFRGRVYNRDDLSSAGGQTVDNITKGQLKEIESVLPYRNGYIPRGYSPHKYSLLAMDTNTGKVSREALFNNRVEAQKAFEARNKIVGAGQSVALVHNKANTSLSSAMFTRNSINVLNAVGKDQKALLAKQLEDMGLNSESVRFMFKDRPGASRSATGGAKGRTFLGTATTAGGKKLRVEHAKLTAKIANINAKIRLNKKAKKSTSKLETDLKSVEASAARKRAEIIKKLPEETANTQEVIIEYLGYVAHNSGHDIWQREGIDHFNSVYGKYLLPEATWKNAAEKTYFNTKGSNVPNTAMQSEIEAFSRFLIRNITKTTQYEQMWDKAVLLMVDKLGKKAAEGNIVAKNTQLLWDNVPLAKDLLNFIRFQTAFPKLLFYPFIQVYIQGSQAITTVSARGAIDPVGLAQGLSQFPRVTAIHARLSYNQRLPRNMKNSDSMKAYEDLIASGYNADLATSDTLWNTKNAINSGTFGKFIKQINKGGALPFRAGESINRTTAFLVVRKQLMRQIDTYERALKAGVKSAEDIEGLAGRGANGEALRAKDIGGASFLKAIVNDSKVLAFNMGKAGELEAFTGFGSIIFQFKQVGVKQIAMFDSSSLPIRAKIAAAAGLFGAFGSGALPFFPDIFRAMDKIIFESTGEDPNKLKLATDLADLSVETFADLIGSDKEFTKRLFEKGIITAVTAGEVDIASRIALGHIVSDTFDVQNWWDLVPASAVFADYIGAARQFALRDINARILNPFSWAEFMAQVSAGRTPREAMLMLVNPQSTAGKLIAGDSSFLNFSLESLRELGIVFSQAGSVSRLLDAANMYEVHPDLATVHPDVQPRFSTSSGNITDVELTFGRGISLLTGLTPGPATANFLKKDLEYSYLDAMKNVSKQLGEDLKRATGNSALRAITRYGLITRRLRDTVEKLGLDIKVVEDGYGSARMTYQNLLINYANGKDMK